MVCVGAQILVGLNNMTCRCVLPGQRETEGTHMRTLRDIIEHRGISVKGVYARAQHYHQHRGMTTKGKQRKHTLLSITLPFQTTHREREDCKYLWASDNNKKRRFYELWQV